MLTRFEKVILIFMLFFNLFLWVLFGIAFFCFNDTFSFSSDLVHIPTALDWELAKQGAYKPVDRLSDIIGVVGIIAILLNGIGLWMLSAPEYEHNRNPLLPIPRKLLFRIPWSALDLYFFCFIYIKYFVDYFRVWMHLVPQMFLSAAYLILLAIGFYHLRKQQQDKN